MMTLEERMESGKLYDCTDERLQAQQRALNELVYDYNMTRPSQMERRQELLRKIFADMGEGCYIEPELREKGFQYNFPIRIEDNVWVGAGAVILPGVTIGKNSVIGAGSVVTKDIPAGVVALGVPCRVLREIGDHDREYYFRECRIEDGLK